MGIGFSPPGGLSELPDDATFKNLTVTNLTDSEKLIARQAIKEAGVSGAYVETFEKEGELVPQSQRSFIDGLGSGTDVYVRGNYAYASHGDVEIIDVTDPNTPSVTSTVSVTGVNELAVQGNYVFAANEGESGLTAIDVSDPAAPSKVDSVTDTNLMQYPRCVFSLGNYAFVGAYNTNNFTVIDISDPTAMSIAGSVSDGAVSSTRGIFARGDYVFTASNGPMGVVDISDPTSPSIAGSVDLSSGNKDLMVRGNYAYVAERDNSQLGIVDISDPQSPEIVSEVGGTSTLSDPAAVFVYGDYAYVGLDDGSALVVVDISNKENPDIINTLNTTEIDGVQAIFVKEDLIYMVNRLSGAFVIVG